jgi:hypothetical protein
MSENTTASKIASEAEHVVTVLKGTLDKAASGGETEVKTELNHIIQAAKYLQKNWKKAVPAIAAMGASAYLLTLRKKAKSSAKPAKKLAKSVAKSVAKKGAKMAKTAKKSAGKAGLKKSR